MTTLFAIYTLPMLPALIYVIASLLAICGCLALTGYAIHKKGDFRAEMSHGKTVFKLEAKERRMSRK